MFQLPDNFEWRLPWSPIEDPDDGPGLADELRREISAGHVLAEYNFVAIGQSKRYDDFLFATDCAEKPLAFVHLTWGKESNPSFPFTAIYRSLDEWVSTMTNDNLLYIQEQAEDLG